MSTTAVVVTYNSSHFIGRCLDSLAPTPTVVVDNASRDDTLRVVGSHRPNVRVVRRPSNGGYAVAVNAGAATAPADDIFLVNPDVVVPSGGLHALSAYLDAHPTVGIAVPRLVYSDGSPQESVRRFPNPLALLARRAPMFGGTRAGRRMLGHYLYEDTRKDLGEDDARAVDWALGGAMLVRRTAWSDVGGMNEWFFLYGEDIDWCYRMWKRGWEVHIVPSVVMEHEYRRQSRRTMALRDPATRHHWLSIFKLFLLHPGLLIGRSPGPG